MDTSFRYSSDSKSLRIRAKQKLSVDPKTLIQAHGELDTRTGAPSYLALIIRRFYPDLSASVGVGVQTSKALQTAKRDKFGYYIRGKKAISLTSNGFVGINIKGRCDTDKEFKERKARGALEFVWSILDFQKDQDVRIKVGYEISQQVPYFQLRENNWTLNADANGKWNVRFDL
ncbi:outer envelope pore protein 21, chloroplastic-like [Asparagus officinalis]|uniref:outer envelope pore protein 21, chloroplastic-like n=1 Tax=Asparagus officinalis TaxID=4686 RepID=UPI00098E5C4F|nr:outer envelope pore protein 21, chloroplastic-like [Asparagus officinalis]